MTVSLPFWTWLRGYNKGLFWADAVAALTLAAYLIPAALGDASLASLPPELGLYACLFGGLVYWLFCSSRRTVVSVTSAISLLIGASLGDMAGGDVARFDALASGTALLAGGMMLLAWLVKAGAMVSFISESVMTGFKCGVALVLASTQLPKLLGFHGAHGSFWINTHHLLSHLNETNATSALVGGIALALLVLGKIFLKNKPVALFVVAGGIIASAVFALNNRGVQLLGEVPQGLPGMAVPGIHWADLNQLLALAFACFLLAEVETAAIGRMFSATHGEPFDENTEFLALAGANIAAGFGHGFPVGGGMSQSLVNESAGARTPLSTALASLLILAVVLFFSHLLSALPQPVLAAVVLVAVGGLINLSGLKQLWRCERAEFVVAVAALGGVLTSGLLRGVMIGAIISLAQVLRLASRPHVAFLGRIPGTQRFSDRERHPDNEQIPRVLVARPESGLVYFNVDHVCKIILERVQSEAPRPELLVMDFSAVPRIDMQSAHAVAGLANEVTAQGIRFQVVEARASVRDRLRGTPANGKLGTINRRSSLADAINEFGRNNLRTTSNDLTHLRNEETGKRDTA